VAVSDAQILDAQRLLASEGVWVEPASAAGLAGLMQEKTAGRFEANGKRIVVVCTGHGMKDPSIITESFQAPQVIPADYQALVEAIL
jgi:threonine synthase